jgi:hypothetical protein
MGRKHPPYPNSYLCHPACTRDAAPAHACTAPAGLLLPHERRGTRTLALATVRAAQETNANAMETPLGLFFITGLFSRKLRGHFYEQGKARCWSCPVFCPMVHHRAAPTAVAVAVGLPIKLPILVRNQVGALYPGKGKPDGGLLGFVCGGPLAARSYNMGCFIYIFMHVLMLSLSCIDRVHVGRSSWRQEGKRVMLKAGSYWGLDNRYMRD